MSQHFGKEWTPEEDETVRLMAEANATPFAIAARLKRTVSSIRRRAPVIGVKIRSERERKAALAGVPASRHIARELH